MPFTPWEGGGGATAETVDIVAGETIAAGEVVYLSFGGAGTTSGRAYLCDADSVFASTSAAVIGICTVGGAAAATISVQLTGTVAGLSSLTAGKFYGLSSTAGALALTADLPTIGYASSTTELQLTGEITGLSSLVVGTAYASDGSGDLAVATSDVLGYATSTTSLLIRGQFGSTAPTGVGDAAYLMGGGAGNNGWSTTDNVDTATITALAVTADVATLSAARRACSGAGSGTRTICAGGYLSSGSNVIDYTDAHTGTFSDFGDLLAATWKMAPASNSITALFGGGSDGSETAVINEVTIASTGSESSPGDITQAREGGAGCSSPARGFFLSGGHPTNYNIIDTTTFASATTATDAGDLPDPRQETNGASNATRGVVFGGNSSGTTYHDTISYCALTSTTTGYNFGDLNEGLFGIACAANATRAAAFGGYKGTRVRTIQYVTIATTASTTVPSELLPIGNVNQAAHSTGGGGLQ